MKYKRIYIDEYSDYCSKHNLRRHFDNIPYTWIMDGLINDFDNWLFVAVCSVGYFETAQWLCSIHVNIHTEQDMAFVLSCDRNYIDIAKWLYSKGADIHTMTDIALRWSCSSGNFEMVKWLYSIGADIQGFK